MQNVYHSQKEQEHLGDDALGVRVVHQLAADLHIHWAAAACELQLIDGINGMTLKNNFILQR